MRRFAVQLDGRAVRTPGKNIVSLATQSLADEVAGEWQAQEDHINPESMPLTQIACTVIDRVSPNMSEIVEQLCGYAGSDLLCYRVDQPKDLAERQEASWQPVLNWLAETHQATLSVTTGIIHVEQPQTAIDALRTYIQTLTPIQLTCLTLQTQAMGSLGLGLAVLDGFLDADAAVDAAQLDEVHQAEQWGEDREALQRLRILRAEVQDAAKFLALSTDA